MEKSVIAQALESKSMQSGRLFAQSEINAGESLELFAASIGTEPTFEVWERERLAWTNGYVEIKPKAKGDAAYQAFGRFKNRLVDAYGLTVPKSKSAAAEKKRAERQAKQDALLGRFEDKTDTEIHDLIARAYEKQARNPLASDSEIKDLRAVLKARTKGHQAETRAELKVTRDKVIAAVRKCTDFSRLDMALEILDETNEVKFTQ